MNFFKEFGKAFVPESLFGKPIRTEMRKYLLRAGYTSVPYDFFGALFNFVRNPIIYLV